MRTILTCFVLSMGAAGLSLTIFLSPNLNFGGGILKARGTTFNPQRDPFTELLHKMGAVRSLVGTAVKVRRILSGGGRCLAGT